MTYPQRFKVKTLKDNGYLIACELKNAGFSFGNDQFTTVDEINELFRLDKVDGFSVVDGKVTAYVKNIKMTVEISKLVSLNNFDDCELPLVEITTFNVKSLAQVESKQDRLQEKIYALNSRLIHLNKEAINRSIESDIDALLNKLRAA